jgi:hypothetical protein
VEVTMRRRSSRSSTLSGRTAALAAMSALVVTVRANDASAAITWKGHTWNVTSGGMAGVAKGSPNNVSIDGDGYLHLKIANAGGTWTAAEVFTTDKLGFGTYQWQVDGPIDRFDENVVLGLFPYGPAGGIGSDGTNEIDIEYSFWGHPDGDNGDWTNYPSSGTTIGELSYEFSLNGGTLSTSRFIWSKDRIQDFLMNDLQAVDSTAGLIKSWTYAPANQTMNIPQQAMPLGINLWCFQAPPSDGKEVEVVIRDFVFVAEGTMPMGNGGATGSGGVPDNGGASGSAGSTSRGGTTSSGGASSSGGTMPGASGGSTSVGGSLFAITGGSPNSAGAAAGGVASANGGAPNDGVSPPMGSGGGLPFAGFEPTGGGANDASASSGCDCALSARAPESRSPLGLVASLLALVVAWKARRANVRA